VIGSLITTAALGREFFSVLYYHLWPLWLYHIFQHCLINGPFSEKLLNTEYVLRFSLQLLSEKVLILRIIERDVIINYIGPCVKYQLFLSDFNSETCHFSTFCKKTFKYQISWKSVQWEPNYSMRTDEHDEANNRLL